MFYNISIKFGDQFEVCEGVGAKEVLEKLNFLLTKHGEKQISLNYLNRILCNVDRKSHMLKKLQDRMTIQKLFVHTVNEPQVDATKYRIIHKSGKAQAV
jgi:hypothetical protein